MPSRSSPLNFALKHALYLPSPHAATPVRWPLNALAQPDLLAKLADPTFNIALENHMYGIPPPFYQKFPVLSQWYTPLSTTLDRNGIEYISTMEGIKYPFFGKRSSSGSRRCNSNVWLRQHFVRARLGCHGVCTGEPWDLGAHFGVGFGVSVEVGVGTGVRVKGSKALGTTKR